MLYPTELLGHISKLFNFSAQTDSNELPLRRRPLYPPELRGPVVGSLLYPTPRRLSIRRNGTGLQFSPGKWGSIETTKGPRSGARPQRERSYYGNLQPSLLCGYQPGRPELSGHPRRGAAGCPGPSALRPAAHSGQPEPPLRPAGPGGGPPAGPRRPPLRLRPRRGDQRQGHRPAEGHGLHPGPQHRGHEAVLRQPGLPGAGGGHRLGLGGMSKILDGPSVVGGWFRRDRRRADPATWVPARSRAGARWGTAYPLGGRGFSGASGRSAPGGPPARRGSPFLPRNGEKEGRGQAPWTPGFIARSLALARFGVGWRIVPVEGLFRTPSTCPDLGRFFA